MGKINQSKARSWVKILAGSFGVKNQNRKFPIGVEISTPKIGFETERILMGIMFQLNSNPKVQRERE